MTEVCTNESHESSELRQDSFILTKEDEEHMLNYDMLGIGHSCIVEKLILIDIKRLLGSQIAEIEASHSRVRFKNNKVFEINISMNYDNKKYYLLNVIYIFNNEKYVFWNSISYCKKDFIIQKDRLLSKMYFLAHL